MIAPAHDRYVARWSYADISDNTHGRKDSSLFPFKIVSHHISVTIYLLSFAYLPMIFRPNMCTEVSTDNNERLIHHRDLPYNVSDLFIIRKGVHSSTL